MLKIIQLFGRIFTSVYIKRVDQRARRYFISIINSFVLPVGVYRNPLRLKRPAVIKL